MGSAPGQARNWRLLSVKTSARMPRSGSSQVPHHAAAVQSLRMALTVK
jgi:hypothetical protein